MGRHRQTQSQPLSTTANHLAKAVHDNLPPQHLGTCEVYGFNRAASPEEKRYLLGLYAGLIKNLKISPKTIHDWRIRGVLVDEIQAAFYKIPEDSRGPYFPWFLQNKHVITLAGKPLSVKEIRDRADAMLMRAWRFTGGSEWDSLEKIRVAIARNGSEEQMCYALYTLLLSAWLPSSRFDIWIEFGFASFTSEEEESALYGQYQRLITMCTFDEFCDAYRHHRLLDLFHSKGLQVNSNAHLRNTLSGDLEGWKKSVWTLKKFVLHGASSGEEYSIIIRIILGYGFTNCRNADESQQLEKVYKDFFTIHHGDPLALYEACNNGNLYGFLSNVMPGLPPKHQRLLTRQPYATLSPYTPSGSGYSMVWPLLLIVFGVVLGSVLFFSLVLVLVMYWMLRAAFIVALSSVPLFL